MDFDLDEVLVAVCRVIVEFFKYLKKRLENKNKKPNTK